MWLQRPTQGPRRRPTWQVQLAAPSHPSGPAHPAARARHCAPRPTLGAQPSWYAMRGPMHARACAAPTWQRAPRQSERAPALCIGQLSRALQRRPDDLIDLGCRCSALLLAPPRCCLQQSTDPIARCAWQAVSRPVRRVHHMLRLGRASRGSPSERQASACNPHLHLCSRRLCCARVRRMQKVTTLVCWQVWG